MAEEPSTEAEQKDGQGTSHVVMALLIGALFVVFAFAPRLLPRLQSGPSISGDAAEIDLPLVLNGNGQDRFRLSAQKGKPVLLDFWATWCGPCRAEAPVVARTAARYADKGLVVVGVNTSDEEGNAEEYAKSKGFKFPIAYDKGNQAARAFHVDTLPTLVLISKDGKILAIRSGITRDEELDRLVQSAL